MEAKKTEKADLESKKGQFIGIGLIVSLLVMIFLFESSSKNQGPAVLADSRQLIEEEEMPLPEEQQPEPEQLAPVPIMSDELNIVDENVDINTTIDFSSEADKDFAVDAIVYVEKKVVEEAEVEEAIPFAVVEQKPMFQGGDQNTFSKWVNSKINYPETAAENGVQGKVTLQFTVDKDGYVKNVTVIRKVDPDLDREAVRVVSSSPRWTPGKQRTKNVAVLYQFPVSFQLQ
ncbi:MAG: energy transducer TonB [Prevotellaceae bacterium]|jgi:protein TonB|nr:energy transducer TonB [Prevotellaceae bacterium]